MYRGGVLVQTREIKSVHLPSPSEFREGAALPVPLPYGTPASDI